MNRKYNLLCGIKKCLICLKARAHGSAPDLTESKLSSTYRRLRPYLTFPTHESLLKVFLVEIIFLLLFPHRNQQHIFFSSKSV